MTLKTVTHQAPLSMGFSRQEYWRGGEGNGNPLHYSCLENPIDRGAWQATVHGVTRVGHDLVQSHPRDPATYTTKTKHPPVTLAPLFQSLPGGNSGTCPQRSQTTYIRFCYVPYITLSCPKEDIFS